MEGCQRQFYHDTTEYPDYRCIDGNLWDDDDCDAKGNLYKPDEEVPCPYCRPEKYDKDELRRMKDLEYDEVQERLVTKRLEDKGW